MTSEANKSVVLRFYDAAATGGDLSLIDELATSDFVLVHADGRRGDRGGLKDMVAHGRAVFPDLRVVADELIVDGDRVVARWTASGTHAGAPYRGLPPSGRAVSEVGVDIWHLAQGRLTGLWHLADRLSLRQQFGLVAEDGPGLTDGAESALMRVLDQLGDALVRRDAAAAAELFAPEADTLLVGSAVGETARGAVAVRQLLEDLTGRWTVAFAWDWRTASAVGGLGWLMAEGTCAGTFDGQEFSVPYRVSMVLEWRGERWLVRQFHGSEPSTTGQ